MRSMVEGASAPPPPPAAVPLPRRSATEEDDAPYVGVDEDKRGHEVMSHFNAPRRPSRDEPLSSAAA
jgi:hypothetical protein